jgi:hypothetical protein
VQFSGMRTGHPVLGGLNFIQRRHLLLMEGFRPS